MSLEKILEEVNIMIGEGWCNYKDFKHKETEEKIRTAYLFVKCQEDFDKIQDYVLELMALHHYYKPTPKRKT